MTISRFGRRASISGVAAALLAGCGGSQPPIGAAGAMAQTSSLTAHADRGESWMDSNTSTQNLLYLSAGYSEYGFVNVYSYPNGRLVGQLKGLNEPLGECVDASSNVFVISYANPSFSSSTIYEYAHGGVSPVATLNDPGVGISCSVDPTTGNLAVGNSSNPYYKGQGSVAVFSSAQGRPTMYYSSAFSRFGGCGYDTGGGLYLQGWLPNNQIELAKLPKGSKSIATINLDTQIHVRSYWVPSVQWDGSHMTISSFPAHGSGGDLLVYRLAFSGSDATVIGTTRLLSPKHVGHAGQSWIYGTAIVGVESSGNFGKVSYWNYPRGGKPTYMIKKAVDLSHGSPWGVTISPAQSSR